MQQQNVFEVYTTVQQWWKKKNVGAKITPQLVRFARRAHRTAGMPRT